MGGAHPLHPPPRSAHDFRAFSEDIVTKYTIKIFVIFRNSTRVMYIVVFLNAESKKVETSVKVY